MVQFIIAIISWLCARCNVNVNGIETARELVKTKRVTKTKSTACNSVCRECLFIHFHCSATDRVDRFEFVWTVCARLCRMSAASKMFN